MDGTVDVYRIFGIPFMIKIRRGLTLNQILEWEAIDRLDPIGQWREDYRWGTLTAQITNLITWAHAKKGSKHTATDFIPNWSGEEIEPVKQSVEQMKDILSSFAKEHNKQIDIQDRIKQRKKKKDG